MVWLFWLLTLNSVVNPWIYMMFNANLVESLLHIFCRGCDCCYGGLDRHHRHRNQGPGRLFGGQKSEATNGPGICETGNGCLSAGSGKLKLKPAFDRSRSNSGGSQTSFTIMTTTEIPGNGAGRKSRSPSPAGHRKNRLSVIEERNNWTRRCWLAIYDQPKALFHLLKPNPHSTQRSADSAVDWVNAEIENFLSLCEMQLSTVESAPIHTPTHTHMYLHTSYQKIH